MSERPTAPPAPAGPFYPDVKDALPGENGSSPVHPEYAFLESVRVPLLFPITVGGSTVSEVSIRRPKVKDNKYLNALRGSEADKSVAFLAHLTGLAPDEMEQLDVSDMNALGEWLGVFVSARRKL